MQVIIILISILLALISAPAYSSPISDMELHGVGQAYYLKFIKVYDAALYTAKPASEQEILQGAVSKCLLLKYDVSLKKKAFVKAADTVLARQFSSEQLQGVQSEIDTLHDAYTDVEEGDQYGLCYDSQENSTTLSHNGKEMVRIVSKSFAQVYFSIWIGSESPLDSKLRDNLLARNLTE